MNETTRPLRVFLCYSSQDKPVVRELYKRLKTENWIDPWLDEEHLLLGQDWDLKIQKELEVADVVIVFISDTSVNKEGYVQKELRLIYDISFYKPEDSIFVIPLRLEDCQPPYRFRLWQWGDYFGDKKENTYHFLLRSLHTRAEELRNKRETEEKKRKEVEELKRKQVEDAKEKARLEELKKERLDVEEKNGKAAEDIKRKQTEDKARKEQEAQYRRVAEEEIRKDNEGLEKEQIIRPIGKPEEDKLDFETKAKQLGEFNESLSPAKTSIDNGTSTEKPNGRVITRLLATIMLLVIVCVVIGFSGKAFIDLLTNTPPISPVSTSTSMSTHGVPTATMRNMPTLTLVVSTKTATQPVPITVSTLSIGDTIISPKDGMTLIYVPAGVFTMGNNAGESNERPVHAVYLNAFWIDQTEVTNAMYAQCVQESKCDSPMYTKSYTQDSYFGNPKFDSYPVIYVSWADANAYCSWTDRRLPTEAEWEKAARGENANIYPWGNDSPNDELLNYNSNIGDTAEVGKYPNGKSVYGALNMVGNVWEWASSLYLPYPYDVNDGREDMSLGDLRVLRGGSWINDDHNISSTLRSGSDPGSSYYFLGFRCARDASP